VGPTGIENPGPIDPSSTFLFSSVDDSSGAGVATYRIDPQTGTLTLVSTLEDYSGNPQTVSPDGAYLLTLNFSTQSTWEIGVFAIDSQTGALTKVGTYSLGSYSGNGFVIGKF
jgi:6-phosphogluconolactonase (cycloisomerase 2 family)